MRELSLDALLVSSPENVRYLTGFTGSNGLAIVTRAEAYFLTDSRYTLQSAQEVRACRRFITARPLSEEAAARKLLKGCASAGFEAHELPYAQALALRKAFPRVHMRATTEIVERLGLVKDRDEIASIRRAAAIADEVFRDVLPTIAPGVTELDIAAEISWLNRKHGGERDAFDVIVASGVRGSLPHARPSKKKVKKGELVTLDFGSVVDGYCSDLTRTVGVGRIPRALRHAYEAVKEAQAEAIAAVRGGMKASALDAVARASLHRRRLGKYFIHSLGHGLGLRIHEHPRISALSNEFLTVGSVITIEPGVYIPGLGGVRIEDDVEICDGRCRLLTHAPRELLVRGA